MKGIDMTKDELTVVVLESVIKAFDGRFLWTKGHSSRVADYAVQIAREWGFEEKEIMDIKLAGLLHDIGEIGSLEHFLNKVSITDKEYEIIKEHPVRGAKIFEHIEQMKDVVPAVRHHHERIDGNGYPGGLKGEEIPVYARILHITESFDSMTSDRPHRRSPGIEYAISELKKNSGSQFDSRAVDLFLKVATL